MNDKSSLASFQLDTVSLRSEAMSEHSVASVRSNSQMVPMGGMIPMGGMVMGMPGAQLPPGGVMLAMPPQPNQIMQAQQQQQQQQASNLESMPSSLTASRQSFRMAMGNSSNEFFVDVM